MNSLWSKDQDHISIIMIFWLKTFKTTEILLWYSNSRNTYDNTSIYNPKIIHYIGKISKLIAIKYYQIITYQQI